MPAARFAVYLAVAAIIVLGGCAGRQAAPVIERAPGRPVAPVPVVPVPVVPPAPAARPTEVLPESYIVKRGETLYGIALDHGLDYRELAEWNGISNPNVIRVGDVLRLRAPAAAQSTAQVKPVVSPGAVESRPLGPGTQSAAPPIKPDEVTIARIEPRRPEPRPEVPPAAAKPEVPAPAARLDAPADEEDRVDWAWPVNGKIVARFTDPGSKGLDISANLGEPVLASAPGRVVYSGSGLRGYGRLIIIKHNPTYLSAYAHNSQILVKEGQNVVKGQKIGEVGATDTDAPKLHFEIRRLGKPVDPLKFLPERPS